MNELRTLIPPNSYTECSARTPCQLWFHFVSLFFVAARKKATYDKFGEAGLKGGIPPKLGCTGAWSSKYVYHGNPDKTFRQFFGGDNPFAGEENRPCCECAQLILYRGH